MALTLQGPFSAIHAGEGAEEEQAPVRLSLGRVVAVDDDLVITAGGRRLVQCGRVDDCLRRRT